MKRTSSRIQHQTLSEVHIQRKMSGQFNPTNPQHSTSKPSLDGFLSYYDYHMDRTRYQTQQPHQLYVRLQSLHRLVFHVVGLAKCVPGFQLMTQHDQLSVVKRQFFSPSSPSSSASSRSSRILFTFFLENPKKCDFLKFFLTRHFKNVP